MSVNTAVNININNFSLNDFALPNNRLRLPPAALGDAMDEISSILDKLTKLFDRLDSKQGFHGGQGGCGCPSKPAPIEPPNVWDSCQPKDSLKTEGNVITTPGGYKIEMEGQFNWKITGPDGKSTKIWGDPHVAEGDGGKWDFKRDSIFKLPDGTEIKVNCVPYGNGMTVTGSLDITCGNDHIKVSDIDKGMGKIGNNLNDGIIERTGNAVSHLDQFVMGNESDDWSLGGKEIIGSNNGGDSFKLGNDLAAGRKPQDLNNWTNSLNFLMQQLTGSGFRNNGGFNNMYHPYSRPAVRPGANQDTNPINNNRQEVIGGIRKGLADLSKAIKLLTRLADLSTRMNDFRNRGFYA